MNNISNKMRLYYFLTISFLFFSLSFFSYSLYSNFLNNKLNTKEYTKKTNEEIKYLKDIDHTEYLFLKKQINPNFFNDRYLIFKNSEPTIKELEIFISNYRDQLSEEEIEMIEQVRQKRISQLMAKKYLKIIESK